MRTANIERETKETKIKLKINLDGTGVSKIETGIPFFDHMLTQISTHGLIDIDLVAKGDIEVDSHHTVEDVGICLGLALKEALGDKKGINRYGRALIPMDETLVLCGLDISGRPFAGIDTPFTVASIGNFETEMVKEFFVALANNANMCIHSIMLKSGNNHHMIEAIFKAFARALLQAISINERFGLPSSKGVF
ncbi:MAG: imidazoleglycerol-phosphate dehydratase HisB [Lachnospiraceae bacterium]|nr:imidazoleglycerol-phosphate dehydratase HisB [Lachnospiraceae bacterium]